MIVFKIPTNRKRSKDSDILILSAFMTNTSISQCSEDNFKTSYRGDYITPT